MELMNQSQQQIIKKQIIQQLKYDPLISQQDRQLKIQQLKQSQQKIQAKFKQIQSKSVDNIVEFQFQLMISNIQQQLQRYSLSISLKEQLLARLKQRSLQIQQQQQNGYHQQNQINQQEVKQIQMYLINVEKRVQQQIKICSQLIQEHARAKAQFQQSQRYIAELRRKNKQKLQKTKQSQLFILQLQQNKKKLIQQSIRNQIQLEQLLAQKRKNNNELQQYRGNIRVFCRIKPSSAKKIQYKITSDSSLTITKKSIDLLGKQKLLDQKFMFDIIFDESTKQEKIFQYMSDLIRNTLDGQDLCIFAYGQTGSGKTYTMNGDYNQVQTLGLIPRTLNYLFIQLQSIKQLIKSSKVSVSITQIYNQAKRDLLDFSNFKKSSNQLNINNKNININSNINFNNDKNPRKGQQSIRQVQIESFQQGINLLSKANQRRSTASTQCNQHSSRSHLILSLIIELVYLKSQQKIFTSNLVLVDLAGSERIKQSKAEGDRMQQAKYINLSLTALGKVMRQIQAGGTPNFRDSQLTRTLQSYLEGSGKAVMFVNISPDYNNQQASIQSLKFAEGVRQCVVKEKKTKKQK